MTNVKEVISSGAVNYYRTEYYIVRQELEYQFGGMHYNAMVSRDTYFLRTKNRDEKYEATYVNRKDIEGKRIPTSMYVRTYIE